MAVSLGRALLLTDGHIIMLRSIINAAGRGGDEDSQPDYRHKWRVRTREVQAIKGGVHLVMASLHAEAIVRFSLQFRHSS